MCAAGSRGVYLANSTRCGNYWLTRHGLCFLNTHKKGGPTKSASLYCGKIMNYTRFALGGIMGDGTAFIFFVVVVVLVRWLIEAQFWAASRPRSDAGCVRLSY